MGVESRPTRADGAINYGNGVIGPSLQDQEDANSGVFGIPLLDKKKVLKEATMVGGGTAFSLGVQSAAMALSFTTDVLKPITDNHPNMILAGSFLVAFPIRVAAS